MTGLPAARVMEPAPEMVRGTVEPSYAVKFNGPVAPRVRPLPDAVAIVAEKPPVPPALSVWALPRVNAVFRPETLKVPLLPMVMEAVEFMEPFALRASVPPLMTVVPV